MHCPSTGQLWCRSRARGPFLLSFSLLNGSHIESLAESPLALSDLLCDSSEALAVRVERGAVFLHTATRMHPHPVLHFTQPSATGQ
jgi:hypothetical protein